MGKELGFGKEEWGVVEIMENRGGRSGGAVQDEWGSMRE